MGPGEDWWNQGPAAAVWHGFVSRARTTAPRAVAQHLGLLGLLLLAGCCGPQKHIDRALLAEGGAAVRCEGLPDQYRVSCPDVLDITVDSVPDIPTPQAIGPDGRLELGRLGRLRVEGKTVGDIASRVAAAAELPPSAVQVQVAEYNSQRIYLVGEGTGMKRAVAYRGPETVLDLLQRTGGIKPGAAPDEVFVVRSRVPEGIQPEVFHIKLVDILVKKDLKTNIPLEPFDQIFIGETKQACLGKHIPPFFRPFFRLAFGKGRPAGNVPPNLEETGKARKPFIFRLPPPMRKEAAPPSRQSDPAPRAPFDLHMPRRI